MKATYTCHVCGEDYESDPDEPIGDDERAHRHPGDPKSVYDSCDVLRQDWKAVRRQQTVEE